MYRIFVGARFQQSFSGSTTATHNCESANSLTVLNDGGSDLTITVNGKSWTMRGSDMPFDEFFEPFTSFTITATGAYRAYTRG